MCCQLKTCCGLPLKTGAIITVVMTAIWCLFCVGISVFFFTKTSEEATTFANDVRARQPSFETTEAQDKKMKTKVLGILSYYIFGFLYIGCLIPGVIALISLSIGITQEKTCSVLMWIIFMTIALVSSLGLSIIHFVTDEGLELYVKLFAPIFVLIFIVLWAVVFSYYKKLQDDMKFPASGVIITRI